MPDLDLAADTGGTMMPIRPEQELCRWLHEQIEPLAPKRYPFYLVELPNNGIYFFYQREEIWGHGSKKPRIVRVGTHTGDRNFRLRIKQHFLFNEEQAMSFDLTRAAPKDHSIFRKNIGRALLSREASAYLEVWNKDMKKKSNRDAYKNRRDIDLEQQTEKTDNFDSKRELCIEIHRNRRKVCENKVGAQTYRNTSSLSAMPAL